MAQFEEITIDKGADATIQNNEGLTPLKAAARNHYREIFVVLLNRKNMQKKICMNLYLHTKLDFTGIIQR